MKALLDCTLKEIEKSQAESFFNENHLQGFAQGPLYLGLFYNDELIQAIIINKKGWHDGNVELTRMATKLNTQVVGGFGKLMKHVSDYMNYNSITSYIYRAWFNGKGYVESGFKIIKENPGKQNYKLHLFDPLGKKSCNMTPAKGSVNAQEVLPLFEKLPFVEFDLR